MEEYVGVLQRTVDTMSDWVGDQNANWTQEIHDDWIGKLH